MPPSPPLAIKKSTVKMSSLIPFYVYKLHFNNLLFPCFCSVGFFRLFVYLFFVSQLLAKLAEGNWSLSEKWNVALLRTAVGFHLITLPDLNVRTPFFLLELYDPCEPPADS